MRRRLLNVLAALSLLACVAAAGLWARSYRKTDTVSVAAGRQIIVCELSRGTCALAWHTELAPGLAASEPSSARAVEHGWGWDTQPGRSADMGPRRWLGFLWYYRRTPQPRRSSAERTLHFPIAALVIATLILPAAVAAAHWRRHRRPRPGRCRGCGYDLRATPDRCPECGTPGVAGPEGHAVQG